MAGWETNGSKEEFRIDLGGKEYKFDIQAGKTAVVGVSAGELAGQGFTCTCGSVQQGKMFVQSAVKRFEKTHPVVFVNVARYMNELSSTWKTGFVEGTCECANIVKEKDMKLAKQLLAEMGVSKETAQKFASPATYKKMEQDLYAPRQELQQTRAPKR